MKKARATWFNVYESSVTGMRRRGLEQSTRKKADHQAKLSAIASKSKLLYRIRVRRYLEPTSASLHHRGAVE